MKTLVAITLLVLTHSSTQAQYSHVRNYRKTNLIASLDPGTLKRKISTGEDSSLWVPIFAKTVGVKFVEPQVVTAYPLSVPSIDQAVRYHRKKGKGKIDLSFLVSMAYTFFFDPYFIPNNPPYRP